MAQRGHDTLQVPRQRRGIPRPPLAVNHSLTGDPFQRQQQLGSRAFPRGALIHQRANAVGHRIVFDRFHHRFLAILKIDVQESAFRPEGRLARTATG